MDKDPAEGQRSKRSGASRRRRKKEAQASEQEGPSVNKDPAEGQRSKKIEAREKRRGDSEEKQRMGAGSRRSAYLIFRAKAKPAGRARQAKQAGRQPAARADGQGRHRQTRQASKPSRHVAPSCSWSIKLFLLGGLPPDPCCSWGGFQPNRPPGGGPTDPHSPLLKLSEALK